MVHTLYEPLGETELTEDNLVDVIIYDSADEEIGSVSHLQGTGPTARVVVDVGGFLGIGVKPVALQVSQLSFMRGEHGNVHATTSLTEDQVKELPEDHD